MPSNKERRAFTHLPAGRQKTRTATDMADAVRYLVDVAAKAGMGSVADRLEVVHGELLALADPADGPAAVGGDVTVKSPNHAGSKDIQ